MECTPFANTVTASIALERFSAVVFVVTLGKYTEMMGGGFVLEMPRW